MRAFFTSHISPHKIIDFQDLPVFDATAYPCIAILGETAHLISALERVRVSVKSQEFYTQGIEEEFADLAPFIFFENLALYA